jgi:hypothetical protein
MKKIILTIIVLMLLFGTFTLASSHTTTTGVTTTTSGATTIAATTTTSGATTTTDGVTTTTTVGTTVRTSVVGATLGVLSGVCSNDVQCGLDGVCQEGECVAICNIGETTCSDGIDNDGDNGYDYFGVCSEDEGATIVQCDPLVAGNRDECQRYCEDTFGVGTYLNPDYECRSPLDNDEGSDPQCSNNLDDDGDGFCDVDGCCSEKEINSKSECEATAVATWYEQDPKCQTPHQENEALAALFAPGKDKGLLEGIIDWIIKIK